MKQETTISTALRAADVNARYDAACKSLLSEKAILAWIMKSCMEEYRACTIAEIMDQYIEGSPEVSSVAVMPDETNAPSRVSGAGSEDATITEGTVFFDIRFRARKPGSGERIGLIINVEAQNDFYPGYPLTKRGFYYCGRMISSQYGREFVDSHYEDIKKVYSVWICMSPPKRRGNTITRYSIQEEALVGNATEKRENYDLMSVVMIGLGDPGEEDCQGLLKLLEVLLSSERELEEKKKILEEEFQIEVTKTLEREVSEMCNLSKGVEEKGIKKGLEQGIEQGIRQGRQEGRREGRQEERIENIRVLMETLNLTAEQAMDALRIREPERPEYRKALAKSHS